MITAKDAKPFLKWAGGKSQLLPIINDNLPDNLKQGNSVRYIEPFVGSGAVLFYLLQNYSISEAFIFDVNQELITTYNAIKKDIEPLIDILKTKEEQYLSFDKEKRKEYYYTIREKFNAELTTFDFHTYDPKMVERASEVIFLNRTCFNGLFRVNKSGLYNVPMGDYKNPTICDEANLRAVHQLLQHVHIRLGDYKESQSFVTSDTFVYFDPPYRPLNTSSSFTSYSKFDFNDQDQKELAAYFFELDKLGANVMLSNSDPKNTNPEDNFFDALYQAEHINIKRIDARRNINSKAEKRGTIKELLITNY